MSMSKKDMSVSNVSQCKNYPEGVTIFNKDGYICFRCGTNIVLYNTAKPFEEGHTHLKSVKAAYDAVTFCKLKKIPKNCRTYYLISLQRITVDEVYAAKIQELIDTRHQKGKKQSYLNVRHL